jgi:hypothetical protein
MSAQHALREWRRRAEQRLGVPILLEVTRGGHVKAVLPSGGFVFLSATPSCRWARRRALGDLLRVARATSPQEPRHA